MAEIATQRGGRVLPRLHWGPVIAGVLVALATQVVVGLIGAAMGFAAAPAGSTALGAGAAIWALITPFVASLLGAWVACKMAGQFDSAGAYLHGIMVWCIALLAGAVFLAGTMASGAMSAGMAASGGGSAVGATMGGQERMGAGGPSAQRAQEQAGRAGAALAGGAAMAAIAGLLGAVAGAGIARSRREGKGLGWRIAIERDSRREGAHDGGLREREVREATSPTTSPRPATPVESARPDIGTTDPYHH
jgi:hypothetical protein